MKCYACQKFTSTKKSVPTVTGDRICRRCWRAIERPRGRIPRDPLGPIKHFPEITISKIPKPGEDANGSGQEN